MIKSLFVVTILTACAFASAQTPSIQTASGVTLSTVSCYEDLRFFDNWQTTTTASWSLDSLVNPNIFDVEVRQLINGQWLTVLRVPVAARRVDVSLLSGELRFYAVNRRTFRARLLPIIEAAEVHCMIRSPQDGQTWVWSEANSSFMLRLVDWW